MEIRLLTVDELADYLSFSKAWVWRAARTGRIPSIRVGRSYRFNLDDVMLSFEETAPEGMIADLSEARAAKEERFVPAKVAYQ